MRWGRGSFRPSVGVYQSGIPGREARQLYLLRVEVCSEKGWALIEFFLRRVSVGGGASKKTVNGIHYLIMNGGRG